MTKFVAEREREGERNEASSLLFSRTTSDVVTLLPPPRAFHSPAAQQPRRVIASPCTHTRTHAGRQTVLRLCLRRLVTSRCLHCHRSQSQRSRGRSSEASEGTCRETLAGVPVSSPPSPPLVWCRLHHFGHNFHTLLLATGPGLCCGSNTRSSAAAVALGSR